MISLYEGPLLKGLYPTYNGPKTLAGLARCALEYHTTK